VKRYILFHKAKQGIARHPAEMGATEIETFHSDLVQEANVSVSMQNQTFNALLFLYRNVFRIELATSIHALRVKRVQHLPTVLSTAEVNQVLNRMQGLHQLMARLLYGFGLHLMECLPLRVKDIDFEQSQVLVREKDRLMMPPAW
jgi:integrase